MLKLGNDIVDLSSWDVQKKYLDERFLFRVFSPAERDAIYQSVDKSRVLWLIWAAKEAAFKVSQKIFPELVFSHQKFSVTNDTLVKLRDFTHGELVGLLIYQNHPISLCWHGSDKFVHCLAVSVQTSTFFQDWDNIYWKIVKLDLSTIENESLQIRRYAKQFFQQLGLDSKIEIVRNRILTSKGIRIGPPQLYLGQQILPNYELSLSHDGFFGAIACANSLL